MRLALFSFSMLLGRYLLALWSKWNTNTNTSRYLIADLASSFITSRIGLRYSLLLGCCLSSAGCLIISFAPPYPVFVIGLSLLGGGSGTFDSNLTTVVSHHGSPLVMSIFFGMYGCGTVLSPILATLLLDDVKWNVSLRLEPVNIKTHYYYYLLSTSEENFLLQILTFLSCL